MAAGVNKKHALEGKVLLACCAPPSKIQKTIRRKFPPGAVPFAFFFQDILMYVA
jgi:hypothetical protein